MNCIVDGMLVNYLRSGRGPVIVLLHGWGDSLKTFANQSTALAKEYDVVSVDLPGFGGSDAPKDVFSLEKYANFVSDFLSKIEVKHVYAFVGHSNGGAIAIKGLAGGILHAEKLVLLSSAGIRSTYKGRKKALRLVAKVVKLPTKLLPKNTQIKLRKKAYHAIGSDLFVAENLQETFKQIVSEDIVLESAMIQQPTLLIYGADDSATPPIFGSRFNDQIENSELVIMQGADHFLHHTHPGRVNNLVEEFLGKK